MDSTIPIISAVVGLAIGFIIAKFLEKGKASKTIINARKDALSIIKEAKNEGERLKKDKIFQAKERFLELKAEHEKVILSKEKKNGRGRKTNQRQRVSGE